MLPLRCDEVAGGMPYWLWSHRSSYSLPKINITRPQAWEDWALEHIGEERLQAVGGEVGFSISGVDHPRKGGFALS